MMAAQTWTLDETRRWLRRYWARTGTPEEKFWARVDTFWDRVEKGPDCWLWLGAKSTWGYGMIKIDGKMRHAHRLSWEIHNGPIPEGLMVCHHCDVRDCVNPKHLFLGTAADNVHDMDAKGRRGRGHRVRVTHRGENHQAAKLSDAEFAAIQEALVTGEPKRAIARRFGISHTYVQKIARGEGRAA